MIERIIKFSTQPGDAICDCFSGTGTVLRAVGNIGWTFVAGTDNKWIEHKVRNPVTSIELSQDYCQRIAAEHGLEWQIDNSKRWNQWEAA